MTSVIWGGIALALGFCVLINLITVLSIWKLGRSEELLDVIEGGTAVLVESPDYVARARWAEDNGFEPDMLADFHGAVGAGPIVIGVWKNSYKKTFLSTYTAAGKVACEFVTVLKDDGILTTSNAMDSALMPPAPGYYLQVFDGVDLDGLFQKHEAALVHLHQHMGMSIVERWEPTQVLILESIRRQTAYIKSLFLWQLRGVYWYFIRRPRMNGKSIAQQYPV